MARAKNAYLTARAAAWPGLLLLATLATTGQAAGHISTSTTGVVGLGYDSNVGNTPSGNRVKGETFVDGGLATTWRIDQGAYTAWQIRGGIDATGYTPESDLSEARGSIRLRWLHRPGNGFFTPVLAAWVSGGARVSGSDLRNGTDYRVGAYLREQLTTAVSARLAYAFSSRESESRVYDLTGRTVTLGVDWIASPIWTWYTELEYYHGQIVSSVVDFDDVVTTRAKSYHYLVSAAEATEEDEAYGENWYAMKVPATGGSLTLGFNRPLAGGWSLDSRIRYSLFNAGEPSHGYGRGELAITLLMRF